MFRVEALLSARLFLRPELVDDQIFMISNLSGHNNLYVMRYGGSVPKPLLPPNIALQNPHLISGMSFAVFKDLDKILVMIDQDGDENYLPMEIPLTGGFPRPAFNNFFENTRCYLGEVDAKKHLCVILAQSREESLSSTYLCHVDTGEVEEIYASQFGAFPVAINDDYTRMVLVERYIAGDTVAYLWERDKDLRLIYGKPLEDREKGERVPLSALGSGFLTKDGKGLVISNALFQDTYSLGFLELDNPETITPVKFKGLTHTGIGEFNRVEELKNGRFLLSFNIDGASWAYEAIYDPDEKVMETVSTLVGDGIFSDGVLDSIKFNDEKDVFALSFSTANSPTQIFTIEGQYRDRLIRHTDESILGIPENLLSSGEDYSYQSFDELRVSARLYMPSPELGYSGKRPIVFYIHGGPQSQERPDFSWFSMPIIQYLTLQGLAVFVPNVRGSSGYGLTYTKHVDRDWGGKDRFDHVHALTEVLSKDERLDTSRAGVVGRSYGGYMTLTLSARHPELWSAAVDMFGPYDLVTFLDRIPPTWKPYFHVALGDPEKAEDITFMKERSPKTYIENLQAPLLVIQGRNDPRVVAEESEDLVNHLQSIGKDVKMLMFEDEGHGVEKHANKVACYNAITDFFVEKLNP